MSSIRLPKTRVDVQIALPASVISGSVFLAEYALDHAGRERVSDLLNGREEFVPVSLDAAPLTFVARRLVRWVKIPVDSPGLDEAPPEDASDAAVTFALDDGTTLTGRLRFVAPPGRDRVQDYLNDHADRFVPLYTREGLVLVNRRRIATVVLER